MTILEESPDRLVVYATPWKAWAWIVLALLLGAGVVWLGIEYDYFWPSVLGAALLVAWLSIDPLFAASSTLTLDRPAGRVSIVRRSLAGEEVVRATLDQVRKIDWDETVEKKFAISDWFDAERVRWAWVLTPTRFDYTDGFMWHSHEVVLVMKDDARRVVFGKFISHSDKRRLTDLVEEFLGPPPEAHPKPGPLSTEDFRRKG